MVRDCKKQANGRRANQTDVTAYNAINLCPNGLVACKCHNILLPSITAASSTLILLLIANSEYPLLLDKMARHRCRSIVVNRYITTFFFSFFLLKLQKLLYQNSLLSPARPIHSLWPNFRPNGSQMVPNNRQKKIKKSCRLDHNCSAVAGYAT